MFSRILTRSLAILFLFTLIFSVWSCVHSGKLRDVDLDDFIHVKGYLDTWVVKVDYDDRLVELVTIDIDKPRMYIVFEGDTEMMGFIKENSGVGKILPVTFLCGNKVNKDCNLNKKYILFVATRRVKPVIVEVTRAF